MTWQKDAFILSMDSFSHARD